MLKRFLIVSAIIAFIAVAFAAGGIISSRTGTASAQNSAVNMGYKVVWKVAAAHDMEVITVILK